jgi:hypothetical protein
MRRWFSRSFKSFSLPYTIIIFLFASTVKDPDPGSGIRCLFDPFDPDPGSGIGFFRTPDLGSRIPNPYFLELGDKFLGKKFYNSDRSSVKREARWFLDKISRPPSHESPLKILRHLMQYLIGN